MAKAALSVEREKLASAIEQVKSAKARREAMTVALDRATSAVYSAQAQVTGAEIALHEARDGIAEHLIAIAGGATVEAPVSPQQAQANLSAAQEELEAARNAQAALRQRAEAEQHDPWPDRMVKDAAVAVLKVELAATKAALLADADRLRLQLFTALNDLSWFFGLGLLEHNEQSLLQLQQYPIGGDFRAQQAAQAAADARWNPKLKALMDDASAKLD